jgi:hypothetical protein
VFFKEKTKEKLNNGNGKRALQKGVEMGSFCHNRFKGFPSVNSRIVVKKNSLYILCIQVFFWRNFSSFVAKKLG